MQLNVLIADVELEFISIILQTVSGTDSIITNRIQQDSVSQKPLLKKKTLIILGCVS